MPRAERNGAQLGGELIQDIAVAHTVDLTTAVEHEDFVLLALTVKREDGVALPWSEAGARRCAHRTLAQPR